MNKKYKVSVIIPVYNAEKYLKTAIDSIINQTIGFDNVELIIVNDNSKDNSKKIIENYANKYNNIIDIHLDKNSGLPGKPRNIGIDKATADYIIFLDADDEYFPNAFELLYNTIVSEKSDFVMGSHYHDNGTRQMKINILHYCDDNSDIININPLKNQINFNRTSHNHVAPWGKIFNKTLINENNIRFPEDTLAEDTYFYFKTLINSTKITLLPNNIIYKYNIYETSKSTIHKHNLKAFNNYLNGFDKVMDILKNVPYSKRILLTSNLGNLLLILTNLDRKDKKDNMKKLNAFEMKLDEQITFDKKELNILNKNILKKQYTKAIIISEIYKKLYGINFIKQIYRKNHET
ncbi:MAG: glycosyltransferase family 2 protein [Methanobrevibacter millerae]|uniref:Glycosyltransferase family 2 protein n=1 Tax=Methanobrevibacter millerae TaxID=230361 RepID=A0A8T3VRY7_9EURY|nr:glycosyltransferase family 2 protein [Methanobrevibacter millerae]